MPFRDAQTHLRDIQESIDHINEFVAEMDIQAYANDLKTKSAVERQLQILTEAVIRLGDDAERICPGPDWVGFHGMGNILRHGYPSVREKTHGSCISCFRPALVMNVRKGISLTITFENASAPPLFISRS